jgi:hypothetical protein
MRWSKRKMELSKEREATLLKVPRSREGGSKNKAGRED